MSKYIEKYPWLRTLNLYTGKVENQYDAMDDMPDGWRIAFGDMFCEEMDAAIKKENAVDEFYISQLKEKFGALRVYPSGTTPEISSIIRKYEFLSHYICAHCGKPDVYMTNTGWILPLCKDCYDKNVNYAKKYEDVIDDESSPIMPNVLKYRKYSNAYGEKGWKDFEEDISETVNKIRKNWIKLQNKENVETEE